MDMIRAENWMYAGRGIAFGRKGFEKVDLNICHDTTPRTSTSTKLSYTYNTRTRSIAVCHITFLKIHEGP